MLVRKDAAGVAVALAAYVQLQADVATDRIRAELGERVPPYMIPAQIAVLDELPWLPNFKIDRQRLSQIDAERLTERSQIETSPLIGELIETFQQVTKASGATPADNILSLGGDSLQALELMLEISRRFRVVVPEQAQDPTRTIAQWARDIRCRQIRAAQRRHRTDGPFGHRHALGNGAGDCLHAAVAPDPSAAGEIGPHHAAFAVRCVTAAAGAAAGLAVKNVIAQDQLRARNSRRQRQRCDRRVVAAVRRRVGASGHECRRYIRAAVIGDAPDAPMHVVGDEQRTIRAKGQPGRPEGGPPRGFFRAGKAVRKHDVVARHLTVGQRLEHDVVALLQPRRAVPGAVKCHERAAAILRRKLRAVIDQ